MDAFTHPEGMEIVSAAKRPCPRRAGYGRPHRQNYNLDTRRSSTLIQKLPFQPGYKATRFNRWGDEVSSWKMERKAVAAWLRTFRRHEGFEVIPR